MTGVLRKSLIREIALFRRALSLKKQLSLELLRYWLLHTRPQRLAVS